MSPLHFLCLDDDTASDSILDNLRSDDLKIKWERPKPFDKQCEELYQNISKLDGLVLDLRLDQNRGVGGPVVAYRASVLAQHLRSKASEKKIKSLPIVLWSTDKKLSESYYKDKSGQDLFDCVYVKKDVPDESTSINAELQSLAAGYKDIAKQIEGNSIAKITKMPSYVSSALDPRIESYFETIGSGTSVHDYARALLGKLIFRPGLLVSEKELGALLGINIQKSADWSKLVKQLPDNAEYRGVFGEGWPRWWRPLIDKWWMDLDKEQPPLLRTEAASRVAKIKQKSRLAKLVIQSPIKAGYSTRYSCICAALNQPLDPKDGFIVEEQSLAPWQSRMYVSAEGALNPHKYKFHKKIDPLEKPRLEALKRG